MDSTISNFINDFNFFMFVLFALMYSYQIVYMFVALINKWRKDSGVQNAHAHKYAVIVAARNEITAKAGKDEAKRS